MSLLARLMLLIACATIVPAAVVSLHLLQERDQDVDEAKHNLGALTRLAAENLDDKVKGTVQLLHGLSRAPDLATSDKAACSDFLAVVLAHYPQYTGLLTVTPDGDLHCDSLRSGRKLNVSARSYFIQSRESLKPAFDVVIGGLTGIGVLQVAYPVVDDRGTLKYVLVASLNLSAYAREFVAAASQYASIQMLIWDRKGTVIARTPDTSDGTFTGKAFPTSELFRFAGSPAPHAAAELPDLDGVLKFWARGVLPESRGGVHIVLGLPREVLVANANRDFRDALAVVLGVLLLALVAVVYIAESSIRRPVRRISSVAGRVGAGELSARIGAPYPRGEIGDLMAVFDRTAGAVQEQRAEIESRSLDLQRANDSLHTLVHERKLAGERIEYLAYYDSLTELPNRSLFSKLLNQALSMSRRYGGSLAVLFIDLDRFKNINDTLGHEAGDLLLQEMAKRFKNCIRESDVVARLGGDEFVVLLPKLQDPKDVDGIAHKLLTAASKSFAALGQEFHVTASIGISVFPKDAEDEPLLMKHADIAMYQAKEEGKNNFQFYSAERNANSFEKLALESSLRRALERGEFQLHYQPKINLRSGRITGMEALLRWMHPDLGMVAPTKFIPVAEETGLIVSIGKWVLKTACAQNVAWQKAGLPRLRMAVNLSARQFLDENLLHDVTSILGETGMNPALLELEITESMLMHNVDKAMAILQECRDLGVRLAVDDFGTGYSSLSNLKRFPIDTIKVDRSFISELPGDAGNRGITDAIIAMGKALSLTVVAEGVETKEQAAYLRERACDEFQGFYFSKAVPASKFAELLKSEMAAADEGLLAPA